MNSITALFYVFSAVLLLAAFRVITARSTVHAALFLVLAFPGFIYVVMKDELVRCRDGAGRESLGVVL